MLRVFLTCALVCSIAIRSSGSNRHSIYSYSIDLGQSPYHKTLPTDQPRPYRRRELYNDDDDKLFLSPYIETGKYEEAKRLARVESEKIAWDVESYAGYLEVDRAMNSHLWFWYFPARDAPVGDAPLIIWLQGGPGASSLLGLFNEIGPFSISSDGDAFVENKYSWSNNHSLLFIDNPVGVGYSFSDDKAGYAHNQDTIGEHLYLAFKQFLWLFPELQPAPLFLVGEGYGGKHVTSLAIYIHRRQNSTVIPINLQGIAIGNGLIDPPSMDEYSEFAQQIGLVDNDVANDLRAEELLFTDAFLENTTISSVMGWKYLMRTIIKTTHLRNVYNFLDDRTRIGINLDNAVFPYERLVQKSHMRKSLHVGSTEFGPMGDIQEDLKPDFVNSVKSWLEELLEHYRVLCYSGQLDVLVPYSMSVKMYESFRWSGREKYQRSERKFWYHKGQLAGYHRSAGKFTEVLVRNAGHMVPADQPERALALISTFARNVSLDADSGLFGVAKGKDISN